MAIFPFDITASSGQARTGVLQTSRGDIRTPAFMPVGTAGTVKGLYMAQVKAAGSDIILGNTILLNDNNESETTTFSIRVKDRAGNWSNSVETEEIMIEQ